MKGRLGGRSTFSWPSRPVNHSRLTVGREAAGTDTWLAPGPGTRRLRPVAAKIDGAIFRTREVLFGRRVETSNGVEAGRGITIKGRKRRFAGRAPGAGRSPRGVGALTLRGAMKKRRRGVGGVGRVVTRSTRTGGLMGRLAATLTTVGPSTGEEEAGCSALLNVAVVGATRCLSFFFFLSSGSQPENCRFAAAEGVVRKRLRGGGCERIMVVMILPELRAPCQRGQGAGRRAGGGRLW